jgi:hypothetical protein
MNDISMIADLSRIFSDADAAQAERDAAAAVIGFLAKKVGKTLERRDPEPAPSKAPGGYMHGTRKIEPAPKIVVGEESSTLADQILEILPSTLVTYPKGPGSRQIAELLDAAEHDVRRAMKKLDQEMRAVMMRRHDSSCWHLIPNDYTPPFEELTGAQSRVLRVLRDQSDERGETTLSTRDICLVADVSKGSVSQVIFALEKKCYVECVSKGVGTASSVYRVTADGRAVAL